MIGGVILIQAVLASKSLGYEYTEDILTSTVFGALRYLRPDIILIPFIEASFLYNEQRTNLWKKLNSEGIELRCYREIEYVYWPRNNNYGEPDLIILFKNHIHGYDDFLLIVEAKFKSGKSGTEENDQLVRYYEAITNDIENFSEPRVSGFKGKKGYIVYLTEAEAYSDIAASSYLLGNKYNELKDQIFHLKWQQLYKTFETMYEFCSSNEKAIVNDLIEYLKKLGLRDFSGISLPDESLNAAFSSQYPIFYRDKFGDKKISTYFNQMVIELDLNHDKTIFYRGN